MTVEDLRRRSASRDASPRRIAGLPLRRSTLHLGRQVWEDGMRLGAAAVVLGDVPPDVATVDVRRSGRRG